MKIDGFIVLGSHNPKKSQKTEKEQKLDLNDLN